MIARFLSLAALSQLTLVGTTLILLPLQIHNWGHDAAAVWLGATAMAAFLSSADLGLRNVGFSLLARGLEGPAVHSLWSIIRAHLLIGLVIVSVAVIAQFAPRAPEDGVLLVGLITLAAALDALYLIRATMLEASGLIAKCEALFLSLALSRLVFGAIGIAVFDAQPVALAVLWLVTCLITLALQSRFKAAARSCPLFGKWDFSEAAETYRSAMWSAAAPLASWTQIQLPVMALAVFAPAPLVSAFVAIRSLFSLVRAVILQISRIISIQFVERSARLGVAQANMFLLVASGVTAWVATGISLAVFAEHQMMLGPLFALPQGDFVQNLSLCLALASIFAVHQIFGLTLVRKGEFRRIGVASYINCAAMALVGVISISTRNIDILVIGVAICDVLFFIQVLRPFLSARGDTAPNADMSFLASIALFCGVTIAGWLLFGHFYFAKQVSGFDFMRLATAMAIALGIALLTAGVFAVISRRPIRTLLAERRA